MDRNAGWLPVLALMTLLLAPVSFAAELYKWIDDEGSVHYSDKPTLNRNAEQIEIEPGPCEEERRQARQRLDALLHKSEALDQEYRHARKEDIAHAVVPLPDNTTSKYLETSSTGFTFYFDHGKAYARYWIFLKARPGLPFGAYLEAHFVNPQDLSHPILVGNVRQGAAEEITIASPKISGLTCGNYEIAVYVYRNRKKSALLGVHHQQIQSKVDLSLVHSNKQLMDQLARKGHCCP